MIPSTKWVILLLTSLSQFSFRFFVDYPSLLATEIKNHFIVDQFQINLLFSFRSFPNIVMPFVGGMLLDRYGTRRGLFGFMLFIIFGTFLCYLSIVLNNFTLMLIGRFFMGLFLECCYVGIYKILSKWFKEASFAYSIDTAFICGGTIASTILLPYLVNNYSLETALLACLILCVVSFIGLNAVTTIDKIYSVETKQETIPQFSFALLTQFNIDFYIIALSSIFCYTSYNIYSYNNAEMFKAMYHLSSYSAATLYGLPCYMAIFIAPYLGHLVDKHGYRMQGLQITSVIQLSVFTMVYLMPSCETTCLIIPAISQLLNGIFFAAYVVTLWPCIQMVVSNQLSGTAFGVVYSSVSFGVSSASIFIGKVVQEETQSSYSNMLGILLLITFLGASMNYLLYYRDSKYFNNQKYVISQNSTEMELKMLD
ncbi:unnamed protein product (macronuclear) [Paramecium tetraurelia]|uniref:Lysosomal dipeptide transporter MFSD1 n=1 Tax=Paramecium tetraurelia TaxID=5888 RepID=A0CAF5_PARTE|nr:uncharacterized protein GSPATT00036552001 [Paramecium tetraurelia]CAK67772.1 unnamed protein product [Paramecium tetraurelia]|eukprot:XP_001435169.1 hypothetical protein (macronuclear) [Paramecium tetraurelia strain d4-2]